MTDDNSLKSYGEWIYRAHSRNLPSDAPPPAGYESHDAWFRRMRGMEPAKPMSGARFRSMAGFVALPLAAASAGLGMIGMPKASAATADMADLAGGMTPTNGSLVEHAYKALNNVMPRCADDIARTVTTAWHTARGTAKPVETQPRSASNPPISQ